MSELDDKINSLSSDELDTLNSDPKLLEDFKSKYTTPPSPYMEAIKQGVQAALPTPDFAKPLTETVAPVSSPTDAIKAGIMSAGETLRNPTRISPTMSQPGQVAGDAVEKKLTDEQMPLTGKTLGFGIKTALDPNTWALMGSNIMSDKLEKELPNLLEKAANIPAKATEMGGYNLPAPKPGEIEQGAKAVKDTLTQVWKEHGQLLNEAKSEIGIPSTEDEIATSVRRYGNEFGLDLGKPLALPKELAQKAPVMEEKGLEKLPTLNQLKNQLGVGEAEAGTINPKPDLPLVKPGEGPDTPHAIYRGSGFGGDFYDVYNHPEINSASNVRATFSGEEGLKKLEDMKIPLIGKAPEAGNKVPIKDYGHLVPSAPVAEAPIKTPSAPMPYSIGEHDTPRQLMTEINRFKANLPYIAKQDQAKAASYFQNEIVNHGVFKQDIAKGRTMGVLKSQYGDLANVISNSSSKLQSAKSAMSEDLYTAMKDVQKKLSGPPGKVEAYLRNLFTTKSPIAKDHLQALAKLETMSGKPVLQNLFKKFAGEAYGQTLGQSVHTVFQAPYAALTSPKYVVSPLMKYGPGAIQAGKAVAIGAGEQAVKGFSMNQTSPEGYSQLQSLRDRMANENAQ